MCLLLEVLLPAVDARQAGTITREAAAAVLLPLCAQRQPRAAAGARFVVGNGCSCELLGDDAGLDAGFYTLAPETTAALVRTLEFLLARAGPEGAYVRAAWTDGASAPLVAVPEVRASSPGALLGDVRAARIASARVYRVAAMRPGSVSRG